MIDSRMYPVLQLHLPAHVQGQGHLAHGVSCAYVMAGLLTHVRKTSQYERPDTTVAVRGIGGIEGASGRTTEKH
jgi:hypothetical protein